MADDPAHGTAHECRAAINDGAGAWLGVSRAALPHPCADVIWAGGGLLSPFSLTIRTHPEASSCPCSTVLALICRPCPRVHSTSSNLQNFYQNLSGGHLVSPCTEEETKACAFHFFCAPGFPSWRPADSICTCGDRLNKQHSLTFPKLHCPYDLLGNLAPYNRLQSTSYLR